MPYLVHTEKPEPLSWSQFIREPYEIKKAFVMPGIPALRARRIHPTSESRAFGRFIIHLGQYAADPVRNRSKMLNRGLPVAATLDGVLVGAVNSFDLWVHPACRKDKLAVEMIVDRFRYTRAGAGAPFEPGGKPMLYTPEGFAALKAGYREIVRRGLIDPGPAGCP